MKDYAGTVKELAARVGISRKTLYRYMEAPGFPLKSKHGWSIKEVMAFAMKMATKSGETGTQPRTLKDMKLVAEIALLRAKLQRVQAEWIPLSEIKTFLGSYAHVVNAVWDQWVEYAASLRNPKMLQKAKDLRDMYRQRLTEEVEKLDDLRAKAASREALDSEGV